MASVPRRGLKKLSRVYALFAQYGWEPEEVDQLVEEKLLFWEGRRLRSPLGAFRLRRGRFVRIPDAWLGRPFRETWRSYRWQAHESRKARRISPSRYDPTWDSSKIGRQPLEKMLRMMSEIWSQFSRRYLPDGIPPMPQPREWPCEQWITNRLLVLRRRRRHRPKRMRPYDRREGKLGPLARGHAGHSAHAMWDGWEGVSGSVDV